MPVARRRHCTTAAVREPAVRQPTPPNRGTTPASKKTLSIGLSDPNTQLVLPWFLADLVDAVNQRTSPRDLAKKLRNGI